MLRPAVTPSRCSHRPFHRTRACRSIAEGVGVSSGVSVHPYPALVLPAEREYCVIGPGGLGGFYGALLQHSGLPVHFIANSDFQHLKQHGLKFESKQHGDFELKEVSVFPTVTRNSPVPPRCSVVLVALKSTQNHILKDVLPRVLAPGGVVLVLQNGFGLEQEVADIVGPDAVMGGGAFLCSNKVGPGHILHVDYGDVVLGDYAPDYIPRGVTPRLQQLGEDFKAAGLGVQLEPDLFIARWKKLVWNIPYNGLSVLFDAPTDHIMKEEGRRQLVEAIMQEVVQGAAAVAHSVTPGEHRQLPSELVPFLLNMTSEMTPYSPSMLLDYRAGRPLELEAIYGNPLRSAETAGLELPHIKTLYQLLQGLEAKRRQKTAQVKKGKQPQWLT